jgi:hypothetical protein
MICARIMDALSLDGSISIPFFLQPAITAFPYDRSNYGIAV